MNFAVLLMVKTSLSNVAKGITVGQLKSLYLFKNCICALNFCFLREESASSDADGGHLRVSCQKNFKLTIKTRNTEFHGGDTE